MPVRPAGDNPSQPGSIKPRTNNYAFPEKGYKDITVPKWDSPAYIIHLKNDKSINPELVKEKNNLLGTNEEYLKINDLIAKIRENFLDIKKFFPPYPAGSDNRLKDLEHLLAFRALLEKLTLSSAELERAFTMSPDTADRLSQDIKKSISNSSESLVQNKNILKEF